MKTDRPILSICIPTFNRKDKLRRALDSFDLSTSRADVEIVVVDDGSTDGTGECLKSLEFGIHSLRKYQFQANTGRFLALRQAVFTATGKYCMIWDSDDYAPEGAIDKILSELQSLSATSDAERPCCGIIGLAVTQRGALIGNDFPANVKSSDFLKLRADLKITGDKKEIIATNILRRAFSDLPLDQRRIATSVLLNRIARTHNVLTLNEPLVIKNYLKGGMSDRINIIRKESSLGSFLAYIERVEAYRLKCYKSRIYLIKACANAWRYGLHGRNMSRISHILWCSKLWGLFSCPLGILLFIWDNASGLFNQLKPPNNRTATV